ncbi:exonuclease 1 isoform X2 [Mercurialis annua]|uniref:exonuclease 1 isoform X2 n=1 Tax=Mercurialis annua TaxID=3986 RepID=UPI00215F6FF2|nr:exonuclease 1 isoform X2 [Mercurialis annua]
MGIKDLLRFIKPYLQSIHIKKYSGKRVGIDAYSWLHKGAYSCSMEICLDMNSDKKLRYLNYFMHRINLLRHYKITPVVVFDGAKIPCKASTEHERHRRRETNRESAMEKLKQGNVNAAIEFFQRAVSITPLMAHQLIQILRTENVEFVVAPYEADAQLAYLSSVDAEKGGIAAVITEDSDLLAYGCQAIIFKMDRYGNGEEMVLDKIFDAVPSKPSFQHFDRELFAGMCVLAGCDFLPSVPGIGICKAHSFVSKYKNLDRVLSILKLEKANQMPEDYSKSFREALSVFQHARIYDATIKNLKHIKPIPQNLLDLLDEKLDFLGPELPPSVVIAIAEGNLNPINMEAFDVYPSSKYLQDPIVIRNHCELQKPAAIIASRQKITLVGKSRKASENGVTGLAMTQDPVLTEKKYVSEAVALQKLVSPEETHEPAEKITIPEDVPRKIPKNPFIIKSSADSDLDLSDDDRSDVLFSTPDSAINVLSKKRKLHQNAIMDEEASEITKLQVSETLCAAKESQESVNSKPVKSYEVKGIGKIGKLKKSKHNNTAESKQNSILNFFSRV